MGESVGSSPLKKRTRGGWVQTSEIPPRGKISCSVPRSVSAIDGEKTAVHRRQTLFRMNGSQERSKSKVVYEFSRRFLISPFPFPLFFTATCNEGNTLSTISQDHSSR